MSSMKEYWINAYECAIENTAIEHDISWEEAEQIVEGILEKDPGYLDDCITGGYE